MRKMTFLLLVVMICSAVTTVPAESPNNPPLPISLGAGDIKNGAGIFFGEYNGTPILWRVLADGSDAQLPVSGTGEALLFSQDILDYVTFVTLDDDGYYKNLWPGSNAQTWCTDFSNNWTDEGAEKAAIKLTSVTETNDKTIVDTQDGAVYLEDSYYYLGGHFDDYYCAAPLNNESFFFLSAQEADIYFTDDDDRVVRDPAPWLDNSWWLRSPSGFEHGVGWVTDDGLVESDWGFSEDDEGHGARPAFNLDLAHVLFSSEISSYVGVYKLTLIDSNRIIGVQSEESLTRNSATSVTVPYKKDGDLDHVSLLITNKDDTWSDTEGWSDGAVIQYYTTRKVSGDRGMVEFQLPEDYEARQSNWKVWILAEKVNAVEASDYASAPLEIAIPDALQGDSN